MAAVLTKKAKRKKAARSYMKPQNSYTKELKRKIRSMNGKPFTGWFQCELCNVRHSKGYLYVIDGTEHEICSYCKGKTNSVRIIYTPMGNNQ